MILYFIEVRDFTSMARNHPRPRSEKAKQSIGSFFKLLSIFKQTLDFTFGKRSIIDPQFVQIILRMAASTIQGNLAGEGCVARFLRVKGTVKIEARLLASSKDKHTKCH